MNAKGLKKYPAGMLLVAVLSVLPGATVYLVGRTLDTLDKVAKELS